MSCSCPGPRPEKLRFRRTVSRRDVLKYALSGAGLAALGPVLGRRIPIASGAPVAGQKHLVLIYLDGGADMLNVVIPSNVGPYFTRRPTIQVPNANSLALTGGPNGTSAYRFHPNLTALQTLWDEGSVAIVHKAGYPNENLSHFTSQDIYNQAVRNGFGPLGISPSGWVARYAELYAPTATGAVSIGAGRPAAFVGGASHPLQMSSLGSFNFQTDSAFSQNHTHRVNTIKAVLSGAVTTGTPGVVRSAIDQAFSLTTQVQAAVTTYAGNAANNATYANNTLSRNLKGVATLVYAGFDTRVFYTTVGGFDTHGDEGGATGGLLPTLCTRINEAIGSFAQDMKNMGKWNDTVIAVFTEFGRRNYENDSGGTDHGGAYEMLLAGGAVNGGAYGPDLTDADLNGEYLDYGVDFRDVFREIVNDHLSANAQPVFPEAQPTNVVLGVV